MCDWNQKCFCSVLQKSQIKLFYMTLRFLYIVGCSGPRCAIAITDDDSTKAIPLLELNVTKVVLKLKVSFIVDSNFKILLYYWLKFKFRSIFACWHDEKGDFLAKHFFTQNIAQYSKVKKSQIWKYFFFSSCKNQSRFECQPITKQYLETRRDF